MLKRLKNIRNLTLALLVSLASSFVTVTGVSAYTLREGVEAAHGVGQPTELFGSTGVITSVTNVLLFVVGVLSVIMLIVGGIRYAVSAGGATAVTAAKNTVLYAIVGLLIAFFAYAMVNFVLAAVTPGGGGAGFTDV